MSITNVLKSIRRRTFLAILFCTVTAICANAQTPTVTLDVKNVTVKDLLQKIEASTRYTFAYIDADIDTEKKVTVKADNKPIASIISDVLPNVSMELEGTKIVLKANKSNSSAGENRNTAWTVSGHVVDETGEPVIGATVKIKGTATAVATNFDGDFSLNVKGDKNVLTVSFVGYDAYQTELNPDNDKLNITLRPQAVMLDDVVVVGYGVQNKRDVTTAISSIKSEDFSRSASSDFRDAMAARMPGVQVTSLGGQPDGNVSVRIRGIQSATAGNDPLYVIDGVPSDAQAFANLESSDIESLEVLKDASAAAIYGSRGSCGVVIITTKKGKGEKAVVTYDGQVGWSSVSKKIDMLNAYEFATMFKESRDGAYLYNVPTGSIDDPYELRPQQYHRVNPIITTYLEDTTGRLTDTDWQDAIFRTALTTKHSLSVSGRNKNNGYYVGGSYLYREGTVIGSDFQRFSARATVDGNSGNFKYGVTFSPSYSKTNYVDSDSQYNHDGVIANALTMAPIFPVYNADGSYNWEGNWLLRVDPWDSQMNSSLNPVALATEIDDVREKINLMGNIYVGYEFIKGLEYKLTAGGDYYSYVRNYYRPSYIPISGYKYREDASDPTAQHNSNSYFHWTITNQLSFNRTFGDHSINAVAVYEAEKQTTSTAQIKGTGTAGDDKIRTTKGKTIDPDDTYNNKYSYTFASWLLRGQYSYKSRYMVSASIRRDGSSRFAPNTRWGYFPAASIGWRLSEEKFMDRLTWLDDLKIRASVGQTGNAQIGNSAYLALYSMSTMDLGNGLSSIVYPSQIANDDLGWEKNTQYNVGLDFSAWNGLLRLGVDMYYSKTTNMLFDIPVSDVSGLSSSDVNIGSMENKGIELTLQSNHKIGEVTYSFNANWSLNRNKVLSLGEENADIIKEASYSGAYYLTRVGQPVGCYYLLVQDGIFHNQKELDSYPHFESTQVGDFRFVDADGDGVMEQDDDRVICGNYMPDFYYGFGFTLGYKGFDLAANFQGVYGNEILNLERRYLLNNEGSFNMMKEALQRYPYGELNRATRKSTGNNGSSTSTFHLEDGSYLRLQNITIGYNFPAKLIKPIGLSKLRIYAQGSNLFTWTNYSGYNPEVNKRASDALRPGEDYCSYPMNRTFTLGLNFSF
ncbi:MAG: TonB-dependent receptor [Muribaculum sp.]|nr:TonB-dependent receptor [Muribaculum sp.]